MSKMVSIKVSSMADEPEMGAKDPDKKFEKYELDDAMKTLHKAEEIKADKEMMKALQPHLERHVSAIKSMDQLRKIASKKITAEQSSPEHMDKMKQEMS